MKKYNNYIIELGEDMDFREKIKNDIEVKEAKEIWEKIYSSFEDGGLEKVKSMLNAYTDTFFGEYEQSIGRLKKML